MGTVILPYSAGFAAMFALATVFSVMALTIGSLAITSLVLSYSLIIPTLYGILFLNEKITPLKCGGILLLLLSFFLVRAQTKEDDKTSKPTVKWIIYVLVAFVSNGMCSVVQNAQQRRFNGMQNSNFMILALIISTAARGFLLLGFFCTNSGQSADLSAVREMSEGLASAFRINPLLLLPPLAS